MAMKYTRMPSDTFQRLQLNAGILTDSFDPATGTIGNLLGATTGGISFSSNPSFEDFGEDIDNCPNNMKELKQLTQFDPQISGTFLTCTTQVIKKLTGAADISATDSSRVIPRVELESIDFSDVWWIGDYSDSNTGNDAGFLAIHLINALNTTGFQIQSTKNGKGQMSFEFHGHYSLATQDVVPFEIYCKSGSTNATDYYVLLSSHSMTLADGATGSLTAVTDPYGETVTWETEDSSVATVSDGIVTAAGAGNTIVTVTMEYEGVTYTDTCTIIVTG